MAPSPLDDEHAPLYTVGQVAEMLAVKQAFLRRVDELRVVSPQRSAGGQRRYTRYEIRVIQQVVTMADQGITLDHWPTRAGSTAVDTFTGRVRTAAASNARATTTRFMRNSDANRRLPDHRC